MNPQNKVVTSKTMVKSAFLNQNEDFLKSSSEQAARVPEMFGEGKYSNVEENNSFNTANQPSARRANPDVSTPAGGADLLPGDGDALLDQLLGARYKSDPNEGLGSLKNEALLESLNTYSQLSNNTHFNGLNPENFNDSLEYSHTLKEYDKGGEDFFKGFFNTASPAGFAKFERSDKLDAKQVQLDANLANAAPYLTTDKAERSLAAPTVSNSNLNSDLVEGLAGSLEGKDPLAGLYESFNLPQGSGDPNSCYSYGASDYSSNFPPYASASAYNTYYDNDAEYGRFEDDLIGFSEFEKGLVSMCDEASTQQGSSILSSPDQLNGNPSASAKSCGSSAKSSQSSVQASKDSPTGTSKSAASVSSEGFAASVPSANSGSGKGQGAKGSAKADFYGASTSFGESLAYSGESLYRMDSLAQSLVGDAQTSGGYYESAAAVGPAGQFGGFYENSYTPYSANASTTDSAVADVYKSYLSLGSNPQQGYYNYFGAQKDFFASDRGYYKDEYFRDEKREDDTTPFTHVVSSVATVADTVTPLCSSDLNAEFAETVHVLLERYLVGDLSVESELFSLFMSEFNLDASDVYNNMVKYCTAKNLIYYSYKLLLQSTGLLDSPAGTCVNSGYVGNTYAASYSYSGDKSVTVEVYTQTLLALMTTSDSVQLSRSLFTHLAEYSNKALGGPGACHAMPSASGSMLALGKEADKVVRLYTLNISQMTRADPLVFDRFLSILEDHQGRLDWRLCCLLMSYVLQADLAGKQQFDAWMGLQPSDAACYVLKVLRMTFFARLPYQVRYTLHFLDLAVDPNYGVDFVENTRSLVLFLDYVATNFPLSYSMVVIKLLEKKLFNALVFFNALQLATKCDYGSMVTKICLSAVQVLKGVVPIEFTSPVFGRFEFITLENVNKLVLLVSNSANGPAPGVSNMGQTAPLVGSGSLFSHASKDLGTYLCSVSGPEKKDGRLAGAAGQSGGLEAGGNLAVSLLDVCKVLFACNNRDLFVPLVECCLLVEDFQGAECIMKYYCDYYGIISEPICEKVLLSIALKGNFNYVNRLLRGTQSYESCEVFLTHSNNQGGGANAESGAGAPAQQGSNASRNGLVRLSVYLVRICISILNFNVAMNYVKPLLRLNQQNEEISNTLMLVATRLDSRSKLDSFLSFCERTSILINEACFNVILDSCIKLKNNKRLLRIISKFRVWGLYPNIQTFGIIIKSLSCCNMIQECEELFYNYLTYTSHTACNLAAQSSSAKSSTASREGGSRDSLESEKDVESNASFTSSSTSLSGASASQSSLSQMAATASSQAGKEKERINEIIYGCMFDAYVNNNRVDSAMRLFEDMKVRGQVKPNTIMYTTIIKGYGQNKQLDKAMKIFRMMQQDHVVPNTVTYNSIIDACARVGDMSGATSLLEDMLMNNIEPDLITFSTIIKGYCVQSDMDKSFQLLSIMYERGIMPDVILYNSLLEGCVKSGLLWLCEKLWNQMQEYNIPPSNFTLTILIKMYGRSGQLDKVFELADELPKRYNFSINTHVYTCLMSACITNGKYAMVLDIYKYMKKNAVKPDAKTFETIIQGLSRGGLFREAAQVVMEVYSLSNSNNGEAQIANINPKVLERLFQRFYSQVNTQSSFTGQAFSAQYKDKDLQGKERDKDAPGREKELPSKDKDRAKKGPRDDILLNVTGSGPGAFGNGNAAFGNYSPDDADELNSMYTSLARRLELFGIKIPRF